MIAFVGVGSNLGSRLALLELARRRLDALGVRVERVARPVTTPALPVPGLSLPDFVNTVFRVRFAGTAEGLLDRLQQVERELGRMRDVRWGARTLDLDILDWSEAPTRTRRLLVPHPELTRRNFVLTPLLDVAPELGPALRRFERRPARPAHADPLDRWAAALARPHRGATLIRALEAADLDEAARAIDHPARVAVAVLDVGPPVRVRWLEAVTVPRESLSRGPADHRSMDRIERPKRRASSNDSAL